MTSFAQQPDPGLTRDPAWRHILLTAKIQHAQQWDQSMPKHKGERYIKPIIPQLYPYSSLSPFAVMYARGHDNATEQLGYIVWFSQNEGVRFTVKATVFSIIIHYSSLLIILIVCVCTVWSFITVSFIIYTVFLGALYWYQQKKNNKSFCWATAHCWDYCSAWNAKMFADWSDPSNRAATAVFWNIFQLKA